MKILGALSLAVLLNTVVFGEEATLQRKTVLGGRISLLVPAEFQPMSAELLQRKYPNPNRPSLVFTNAAASINVALDHTAHRVPKSELAAAHAQIRTRFDNAYPSAQWYRSEVRKINGREFFLLEVRTPAVDTEVRNIIVGTSLDDRLLMISFNVTKALEAQWMATGNRIIESIAVK